MLLWVYQGLLYDIGLIDFEKESVQTPYTLAEGESKEFMKSMLKL